MKKIYVMILVIIFGLKAQDSSLTQIGFGISIVDIKDLANTLFSYHTFTPNLSIPIIIKSKFKIEPSFGYYNRNFDRQYKHTDEPDFFKISDKNYYISIGLFPIKKYNKLFIYYGGHVGYIISHQEIENEESKETTTGSGFLIAPSIGSEYFITQHLSVGGEFQLKYYSLSNNEKSSSSSVKTSKDKYSSFVTRTLLVLRTYF